MFVVDGHHRLAAYKDRKWPNPVPVRVYRGGRAVALRLAAADNSKLRLPLTQPERLDWAWKVVREAAEASAKPEMTAEDEELAKLSQQDVAAMAGVGKSTVINMRKAIRLFEGMGDDITGQSSIPRTLSGSWHRDQRAIFGSDPADWSEEQQEAWKRQSIAELTDRLGVVLRRHVNHHPDWIAEALSTVFGRRTKEVAKLLMEERGGHLFED
jgi:ParB-like chromosome segregation protein Spo0J